MRRIRKQRALWVGLGFILLIPSSLYAVGINTDAALPVPQHHILIRTQARYTFADDDPSGADRRLHQLQLPTVLIYGVTAKTVLFGMVPFVYRDLSGSETGGIGDLTFLVRQEIAKRDWSLKTWRLALLGGLEIPSGDDPFSSHSIDFPLSLVTSFQTHRLEIDADVRYKINTEGNGTDHGDNLFYNLAYQHRILPWSLPEGGIPNQLNLVLEMNGQWTQKDKIVGGAVNTNSGGNTIFLSPGIQYVMKRVILETSFQYPILQDMNGSQLKTTFAVNGGMRIQF